MRITGLTRSRVLVAGALALPIVVGSVAVAGAATNDGSVTHTTSQLTPAGQRAAEQSGTISGTVVAGPDGVTVNGKKVSGLTLSTGSGPSSATGTAQLTPEGLRMIKDSGKTSGSISVGADGVIK